MYGRFQSRPWAATIAAFLYLSATGLRFRKSGIPVGASGDKNKIAFICDDMTWQTFSRECNAVYLTPWNWKDVLCRERPVLLFCESAWSGISQFGNCWRKRVYRNNDVRFETRRRLFDIVSYCRREGIPTVFWNKEDPTFFGNPRIDFVDTALRFDHIFTTCEECIPLYRTRGRRKASLLMFGFSPQLYYPGDMRDKKRAAVFAGSWYGYNNERCAQMEKVFSVVLEAGIPLIIYDRQADSSNSQYRFPPRYRTMVRHSVPYEDLPDIYRSVQYVVNINTVEDSVSMFSRRVFEAMACGCIIISNESVGLRRLFGERVWFAGEAFDHTREESYRRQNLREVFDHHTIARRLEQVVTAAGLAINEEEKEK